MRAVSNELGSSLQWFLHGHARDSLPLLLLELHLLVTFLLVKFVIHRRELLHRNQEVSEGSLEITPVVGSVEHLQHKAFHLHLVQIWEHLQ
jgi:hypothetical protein